MAVKAGSSLLITGGGGLALLAGLILLVAMIGAIVLTLRDRPGVKRQNIAVQNARTQAMAVETRKVPSRQGVEV